jgi:PKHD-type hydroxylase
MVNRGVTPVWVMPKAFSKAECEKILESTSNWNEREQKWHLPPEWKSDAAGEIASWSIVRDFQEDEESKWLYEKAMGVVFKANEENFKYKISSKVKDGYIVRYTKPGMLSSWHSDGFSNMGEEHNSPRAKRKLTLVVQLSTPKEYEGCELKFFAYNHPKADLSKQGTAVVFSSFEFHSVTPLISGERRSLVFFVEGPRFR